MTTSDNSISASSLSARLAAVLDEVDAGTAYVVTRHGRPVARLIPLDAESASESVAREERAGYGSAPVSPAPSGALGRLVGGRGRRSVLSIFLREPASRLHQREVARRAGVSLRAAQIGLDSLEELGLIASERSGNRRYYSAVRTNSFEELREMLSRELGVAEVIARHLELVRDRISWATVFGSIARGDDKVGSDADLLVVGEVRAKELATPLAEMERELGRKVDLVHYKPSDFKRRAAEGNHFVSSVLAEPHVDVIGSQDDVGIA